MSFDWVDYLRLARLLAQDTENEAVYRTAISRAYYAAFCLCRNFVRDNKEALIKETADDHYWIRNHFQTSDAKDRRRIGTLLELLRTDRNSADYDDELIGLANQMAAKSIQRAQTIITLLYSLESDSP